MDTMYILGSIIAGGIIGAVILYLFMRASSVSKSKHELLNNEFIKIQSDFENSKNKITELNETISSEKKINQQQAQVLNDIKNNLSRITAEHQSMQNQLNEQKELNSKQSGQIEILQTEKQNVFAKNAELSAINEALNLSLENQKKEIQKIQEEGKLQFENLANKILEEKSEKFIALNQTNLKTLLEPFQEKMNELKNRVNEAYEKENKERFSLAEKVKELAELNQQISEDAKKLTRALKGESKTQGNWGEM